ncbi:hypothetical protein PS682_03824 [Pseudomonas fluorescens]|nr:hypothetical protein PS682_03824 [Pseudomonas fluorescens]
MNLLAAANEESSEYRYKRSGKKINQDEDHIRQQGTTIDASGDVNVVALNDVTMVASKINAGNEAYLVAGNQLNLLAELNRDYSLYDMTKKGSWGSNAAKRDEVTQHTNVGSEIKTGGNLTLKSGGDQRYQVATLDSGKDLTLDSGGRIVFEGVKDFHDESHTKSKGDLAWYKMKGEGKTDETLRQSALIAQGKLVINAAEGIRIDIKQVDQQSVSQTIDAMVQADPNLAWMKQAEARGDIDWRQVKEIHDSFKYESSGLGAGAKIAIAILMSFILGPAGLGLSGTNLAVAASLSTTAVTSTIDNKGNLGLAIKDTFSAGSLKNAAIAGFTAGFLDYADDKWFTAADGAGSATQGIQPADGAAVSTANPSKDIFRWSNATDAATRTVTRAVISSGVSTAIGGGSFGNNFNAALLGEAGNMAMATGFNWVGDQITFPNGSVQKIAAHAIMGGLLAELTGSDFKTGAAAAGLNEALINVMADAAGKNDQLQLVFSQLTGLIGAAAVGGDLNTGSVIAQKATTFNYLYHEEIKEMLREVDSKSTATEKQEVIDRYNALSAKRDAELDELCVRSPDQCRAISIRLADDYQKSADLISVLRHEGNPAASTVGMIIDQNFGSTANIGAIIGVKGDTTIATLAAEAIKQGIFIMPGKRSKAKVTDVEFLPKATRNSAGQINANVSQSSAIKTLESSGYIKTVSKDGSVTILSNFEKTYRFYPSSTSTGQPSASLTINGMKKPITKIRFSGE